MIRGAIMIYFYNIESKWSPYYLYSSYKTNWGTGSPFPWPKGTSDLRNIALTGPETPILRPNLLVGDCVLFGRCQSRRSTANCAPVAIYIPDGARGKAASAPRNACDEIGGPFRSALKGAIRAPKGFRFSMPLASRAASVANKGFR